MGLSLHSIISTVFQGIAFRTTPLRRTVIIGAENGPRLLAGELARSGEPVSVVDADPELCRSARLIASLEVLNGNPLDLTFLKQVGADQASLVYVATPDDEMNIAICQLVEMNFNPARIIARVSNRENVAEFELLGYEVMSPARVALTILPQPVLSNGLRQLMQESDQDEQLADVLVASPVIIGRTLSEVSMNGCQVVELRRSGKPIPINEETLLQIGDTVTLFGTVRTLDNVSAQLNSQC